MSDDLIRRITKRFLEDQWSRVEEILREGVKGPRIETLKKNRVELTPEERAQVMKAKAVWHFNGRDKPSPAVSKAVVNGKTWYWTATHRAGQVRPTLKGAISIFHSFIKGTA